MTLAAVAAHKHIPIERLAVVTAFDLSLKTGVGTRTSFVNRVEIEGQLTDRERTILLNSARNCDVHKILEGQIDMEDQLVVSSE